MKFDHFGLHMDVARACGYIPDYPVNRFRARWNRFRVRLWRWHIPFVTLPRIELPDSELPEDCYVGTGRQLYPARLPGQEGKDFIAKIEAVLQQSPAEVAAFWKKHDEEHANDPGVVPGIKRPEPPSPYSLHTMDVEVNRPFLSGPDSD